MGGVMIHTSLTPEVVDTLKWVQQYRRQLEQEQQIRASDATARELYDSYQTYINITYSK